MLQPGGYIMEIEETSATGKDKYLSTFREVSLEELRKHNKLERRDEKPFELVNEMSLLNEKAYAIYPRPFVKRFVNEKTAEIGRKMHPLRVQRWLFSDRNPLMWPVSPAASAVKSNRKPVKEDNPYRKLEETFSEMMTASLNLYRDLRDAASEAAFFQIYGSMITLGALGDVKPVIEPDAKVDPRKLPHVKEALTAIDKGGYAEAVARIGSLTAQYAAPIPLYTLEKASELVRSDEILSKLTEKQIRRIRSEAGVLALLEPEATLQALPKLLADPGDRRRALEVLQWGLKLDDVTAEQREILGRIQEVLSGGEKMTHQRGKISRKTGAK
jgi:hypothetical protein